MNPGAGETDQYTYTVSIFRGRIVQFEFVAKDGFIFESGPTLNDSRFLPVLRCMMPPDPEDPKDPNTRHYITGGTFLGDGNDFALSVSRSARTRPW